MRLERQAGAQGFGRAAFHIHHVYIAQHVEDHALAVRRDRQRHPRAFAGIEADLARGLQGQNLPPGLPEADIIDRASTVLDPADGIAHRERKIIFMGMGSRSGAKGQQGDKGQFFHFW